MGESQSHHLPEAPEHEYYDLVLTTDQKTLFQTKIAGNEVLLSAIHAFCKDNKCEKEEIFDVACRIYNLGEKSESKDHHWMGQFQVLPKIKERFGIEQGTYLFEYILKPLLGILTTTKSLHANYSLKNQTVVTRIEQDLHKALKENPKNHAKSKIFRHTNS